MYVKFSMCIVIYGWQCIIFVVSQLFLRSVRISMAYQTQLVKVDKMNRSDLLVYKDKKKNQNRVPLVVTYAKQLPDIQKISRDHMPLLHNS